MRKKDRSVPPSLYATHHQQLVDTLRTTYAVSERTLEAFATVPRHPFLPHFYRHQPGTRHWERFEREETDQWYREIYQNQPLVTQVDSAGRSMSSSSQPGIMALMLDALTVEPGMRVLEVGTGTGYQTALLAALTGNPTGVTTVELERSAVERARHALKEVGQEEGITIIEGDGVLGYAPHAPYDRIVITASAPGVALHWAQQLAPGGRLVCVLQPLHAPLGGMLVAQEQDGVLTGYLSQTASFMPLRDAAFHKRSIQIDWQAPLLASLSPEEPLFEPDLPRTNPHFAFFLWMRMPTLSVFQRTKHQDLIFTQEDDPQGYVLFRGGSAKHGELRGERSQAYPLWTALLTTTSLWQAWGQPSITCYHFEMECRSSYQALSLRGPQGRIWPFHMTPL